MRKRTFKHSCNIPDKVTGNNNKNSKRISAKSKKNEMDSLKVLYEKYYQNQLAALYEAVKGC